MGLYSCTEKVPGKMCKILVNNVELEFIKADKKAICIARRSITSQVLDRDTLFVPRQLFAHSVKMANAILQEGI